MWERFGNVGLQVSRGNHSRGRRRVSRQPLPEVLEDRRLLTASLSLSPTSVFRPSRGILCRSTAAGRPTIRHSRSRRLPAIRILRRASPRGRSGRSTHNTPTRATPRTVSASAVTFQLFPSLTPNTVSEIEKFTNDDYYSGKHFTGSPVISPVRRMTSSREGRSMRTAADHSGQPGTSFDNENVQRLAFTGQDQLAMANAGVNTNDTQFFITTTGSPNSELGYGYTIFGQLVSGLDTLTQMTQIPSSRRQPRPERGRLGAGQPADHQLRLALHGKSQRRRDHRYHTSQSG